MVESYTLNLHLSRLMRQVFVSLPEESVVVKNFLGKLNGVEGNLDFFKPDFIYEGRSLLF